MYTNLQVFGAVFSRRRVLKGELFWDTHYSSRQPLPLCL